MLNKVVLIGRVGRNVEVKTSKGGNSFCRITVATNSGFGDNKRTDWHNVVAFGKTADACGKYVQKGSLIHVEGSIQYEQYEKDGKKLTSTNILADHVQFITGMKQAEQQGADAMYQSGGSAPLSDDTFDGGDLPF